MHPQTAPRLEEYSIHRDRRTASPYVCDLRPLPHNAQSAQTSMTIYPDITTKMAFNKISTLSHFVSYPLPSETSSIDPYLSLHLCELSDVAPPPDGFTAPHTSQFNKLVQNHKSLSTSKPFWARSLINILCLWSPLPEPLPTTICKVSP